MLSRVKIPPFQHFRTYIRENVNPTSRTTRLAAVTAGAALTAVVAGVSASPAMAATGSLASTGMATLTADTMKASTVTHSAAGAANRGAPFALSATMVAPMGGPILPAHLFTVPIAKPAPSGPLSPTAHSATPRQLPAHKQPVVRIGVANAAGKSAPAPAAKPTPPPAPAPPPPPPPAPKPYLIYDSVTPQLIPQGQNVATYATGGYAVPASQVAGRNVLWIDTQGTDPGAQALDVEPGDATPSIAASWAFHKLSAAPGGVARIYTYLSEWPAVKAAIATLPQQMQSHIRYWIADPTGYNHVVPGSDATQWYWGKNWDISTATPNF